jgi:hypothetical protein
MNRIRTLNIIFINFLIFCSLIFQACTHKPNLSPEIELTDSDAILLIGVESDSQIERVSMGICELENDVCNRPIINTNFAFIRPEKGYVIAKLKPTENNSRYTVGSFTFPRQPYINNVFGVKKNDKVPAVEAIANKLVYPGTLIVKKDSPYAISLSFKFEPDKAREFIENNYPHFIQKFEFKKMSVVIWGRD